jgi:hypothetical protein
MPDKPQRRITDDEIKLIKSAFQNNDPLLKVLRKVFLPDVDFNAPFSQVVDMWTSLPLDQMAPQDREVSILSRIKLINHLEMQLAQLRYLANEKEDKSSAETTADSSK